MQKPMVRQALRLTLVRLRFVGVVGLAALAGARLDELSALGRQLVSPPRAAAPAKRPEAARYVCPMHPQAVQSEPGKCPSCGMPLRRSRDDEGPHVAMTSQMARLGGLTFATVERRPLEREVTAPAVLEVDEGRVARVGTPVRASVVAIHVAAPGTVVHKGQPLATLSARELIPLGRDLQRGLPEDDATIVLARQRLMQLGLSVAQLDRLRRGHDPSAFELLSPLDGVLVGKSAVVGDQVPELTSLFTVADLSHLWLVSRLPEEDALLVPPGAAVEVELASAPGRTFDARIEWVDAAVDPQSHTLAVRSAVENPELLLRPGMSGRARLRVPLGSPAHPPLVVPSTAVVDTGLRQIVWREDEGGVLEAAEVQVTGRTSERFAVAAGLEEGDRVVAQGAFLLSADQRLRPGSHPVEAHPSSRHAKGDD